MAKEKEMDKLSRDAAAALAAGMSYGKWMALKEQARAKAIPTVLSRKKADSEPEHKQEPQEGVCPVCGKVFMQPDFRRRKYCSEDCKREGQYILKRKREDGQTLRGKLRVCECCGKEFINPDGYRRRYCSSTCRAGMHKKMVQLHQEHSK